jgi:gamma-glutamylcysteine synthetase
MSEQVKTDAEENKLSPEDQANVDAFLKRGVNSVERKPFRPFLLLGIVLVFVTFMTVFSLFLARINGVSG